MEIPTLDALPGLTEEERIAIKEWREHDGTKLVLRVLAHHKPLQLPHPDHITGEGAALRLGMREGYDLLFAQIYLVNREPQTVPVANPTYKNPEPTKAQQ